MYNQTITGTGSALMGAGLTLIQNNLNTGLILIGVGVCLNILVAVLNKYNIPVSSNLG
jgi:hypothetical protein